MITDPVFGPLQYEDFWSGHVSLKHLGDEIPIEIEADESGPTDSQRVALSDLSKNQETLKAKLEKAIFEFYSSMHSVFRKGYDPDYVDVDVPFLKESNQIWSLMSDLQVFIPEEDEGGILLLWECTWEMEHGLGVRILNGEVDEIGDQSI